MLSISCLSSIGTSSVPARRLRSSSSAWRIWASAHDWTSGDCQSESNPPMVMSISYGDQAYNNQPSKVYKDRLNTVSVDAF